MSLVPALFLGRQALVLAGREPLGRHLLLDLLLLDGLDELLGLGDLRWLVPPCARRCGLGIDGEKSHESGLDSC